MTSPALDRKRTAVGARRKAIEREVMWACLTAGICTTDAMRARLLEEFLARVARIRRGEAPCPPPD